MTSKNIKQSVSQVKPEQNKASLLMAATMVLPAINVAHAASAPEDGLISFKYLDYQDRQSHNYDTTSGASSSFGKNRINVKAESLLVTMPIAGEWSVTGTYTADSISGASPKYHTSELTNVDEHRDAGSFSVTRYLPRGSISVGANQSDEHDYLSRGFSLQGTIESEEKNTTFNAGIAVSNDEITISEHLPTEGRHVTEWIVGVTQVLTTNDIMQLDLGYSAGNGYYTDPYKSGDNRPESRDHTTFLTRWNHYFNQTNGASHLSYRYYTDTFGVEAHTLEAEYVQPLGNGWTVMPLARYYTQTAADFYVGLNPTDPAFANAMSAKYTTLDQRLAEYGAISWGFKVDKQLNKDWLVDFKYEQYKQKESWALTGNGDGILEPFSFRSMQIGISRKF